MTVKLVCFHVTVKLVCFHVTVNWGVFSIFSGLQQHSYRNGLQEWECKTTVAINALVMVVPALFKYGNLAIPFGLN